MKPTDRRTFLKLIGSSSMAAAVPLDLSRALAIPANNRTGTINDVEHVIFLMQENRSFDHYFGTMRGVRGFADPRAVRLPSGKPVWNQPNGSGELLPFRPDVADLGQTFLPDPPHGWSDGHAAWNGGKFDRWVPNKGITTMTYHTREDLTYQYALADAFTICDNYFCSLLGPTDPNRYHMWTGWVGNDGEAGGPVITNAEAGYDWSTYPERLERNGVSWKIYQDIGVGLDGPGFWGWTGDPFIGNYGCNALLYFHQYQFAVPGQPLADKAKVGTNINVLDRDPHRLMDVFRDDVMNGRLPQVSWIVAPEAYTEHPNWHGDFGSWYVSQVIDVLASNPDVWSRMALFITYDEEGGFFDHIVPPTPPRSRAEGFSTVDTINEIFPGDAGHASGPYGLGIRVPMLVVSPWTRGGYVSSEVFDHTSMIRFLEARFGSNRPDLIESNITPWRRAVAGDLTSAFDFKTPNAATVTLPDTAALIPVDLVRQPDQEPTPPATGAVPPQEPGVRPARALPYVLHVDGALRPGARQFQIRFKNTGHAAVVFHVRSANAVEPPRTYTLEPMTHVTDSWDASGAYDLSVHGPNGFFRGFTGSGSGSRVSVVAGYSGNAEITLEFANKGQEIAQLAVADRYTGNTANLAIAPGETATNSWALESSYGWYDLTTTIDSDAGFTCHYAGHLENGRSSFSDPLMGGLV